METRNFDIVPDHGDVMKGPHYVMAKFIHEWMLTAASLEGLKKMLAGILVRGGIGFDPGSGIDSMYDDEWMPDKGIAPFEPHEFYIANLYYEDNIRYLFVRYTREELLGWLALGFKRHGFLYPESDQVLRGLLAEYCDVEDVYSQLLQKLEGKAEWEGGPSDPELLKAWRAEDKTGTWKYIFTEDMKNYLKRAL